jgi:thermostable 8-oxoguanine DNA glycosylase
MVGELKGTHQLLVYADDVNTLGGRVRTLQKTQLVVASKRTGLEVNGDRAKYMVMSRDQNAERNHKIKMDNSSSERAGDFRHLGKTLTN